jgi:CHAD domain-containing protein
LPHDRRPREIDAEPSPLATAPQIIPPSPVIELLLSPEDAARLTRLPLLAAYRRGRPRKSALQIVWHDSADRALAEAGRSLSETAGQWLLEKLQPRAGDDWHPAMPAPILAEATSPEAFPPGLLDPLHGPFMPVAAFSGHRRDIPLELDGEAARLSILEGDVRGVLDSKPVCRLLLSGPSVAMGTLAAMLAKQIGLDVPRASLAAEALALANGTPAAPRRRGGPAVAPGSSVGEALTGIVAHLADVIHYWAPLVGTATTAEPVHQMRVALRRLRSALSIFRRAVRDDPAWLDSLGAELKTLAALLGVARDWDVFLAGIGAEVTQACALDPRLVQMLAAATRKRDAAYAVLRTRLGEGGDWRRLGLDLALLPTLHPWQACSAPEQAERLAAPAHAYAAATLDRRLKHLLSVGDSLDGMPVEALHEIRKQAKRLRYAIEFFTPLFSEKQLRRYLARLEELQEAFGLFNDAAVAAGLAASLGSGADRAFAAGAVHGFGAAAQLRARRQVARGWGKFYRATPFWD